MELAFFAVGEILVLLLVAATAWAAGVPLTSRLTGMVPGAAAIGLAAAAGLALLAQACLLLGLAGGLRAPVVAAGAAAVHLAAARHWRRAGRAAGGWLAASRRRRWTAAVAAALLAAPAAMALYPPLGFDQTLYHLPYAQAFAASGGVPFLPDLRFPMFPQLAEVLAAAVLLLAGEVATQWVGWTALAAGVALAAGWAREQGGAEAGWLAAATVAGSPLALYLAATGYVEPVAGLFGLGALYAADRSREHGGRWAALAGLLAGSAAGVKYLGLFFPPAAALWLAWRRPRRTVIRDLALFALATAAAAAPSYGRILWHTGNPLFPFFGDLFGHSAWSASSVNPRGVTNPLTLFTLPWDALFRRQAVGGLPPFSPAVVFGLPVAALAAIRARAVRPLLLAVVAYLVLVPSQAHYLLIVLPPAAVAVAAGAASLGRGPRWRRALGAAALILLLAGEAYAAFYLHRLGPPPATAEERERLLRRELPCYGAIAYLQRAAPGDRVYAVGCEHMAGYWNGAWLGDFNGPESYERLAAAAGQEGLAEALAGVGATHLVLRHGAEPWTRWAEAGRRLDEVYRDRGTRVFRVRPDR